VLYLKENIRREENSAREKRKSRVKNSFYIAMQK